MSLIRVNEDVKTEFVWSDMVLGYVPVLVDVHPVRLVQRVNVLIPTEHTRYSEYWTTGIMLDNLKNCEYTRGN